MRRSQEKSLSHETTASPAGKMPVLRKVTLLQLVAATYFMVSGGPYGLEDLVHDAGYRTACLALLVIPLLWSLPTGLMVGELSSAIPEEGGYYAWVRRGLGPFWGFQEAWLSLAASVFDMAIYPVLFAKYLGTLCGLLHLADPTSGPGFWAVGLGVIAACVVVNVRGARTVGGSSVLFTLALLGPFYVLVAVVLAQPAAPAAAAAPVTPADALWVGIFPAMWNYMGWDNASTIAGEVDRPQRTYPLAMLLTVALVTLTYFVPVWAASRTGIAPSEWAEGAWVDVACQAVGPGLGVAVAVGGMIMGLGMFNALVLSYSRIPVVLAEDGYLPAVFRRISPRTGAPWVSILACAAAWALALGLPLKRLFALDVTLYGPSLLLEFVALVVLRRREPRLPRPFRVPGGIAGAVLLGVGPTLLVGSAIGYEAFFHAPEKDDVISPANTVLLGAVLAALGPVVYFVSRRLWRSPAKST
jgi:amino acid transporter